MLGNMDPFLLLLRFSGGLDGVSERQWLVFGWFGLA